MEYRGMHLDDFQADAIRALQEGHSVLVSAPTGTGKTLVADWLVETELANGKEVIYTAPIKALSNQKFRDYCALLGDEKAGLVTGDLVIRRDAPCRVMTTEILRNILLTGEAVPNLAAVIVDEIHFLDDRERGTTWEEVLLYLPREVQVLGLSATLANLDEFRAWLENVRERPVVVVEEHRRAVPLTFAVANRETGLVSPGEFNRFHQKWAKQNAGALKEKERAGQRRWGSRPPRGPELERPTRHLDLFRFLVPDQLPYLYFVFSRRQAEAYARQLALRLEEGLLNPDERRAVDRELEAFRSEPAGAAAYDPDLADLYRCGIAFHHAGLHVLLKALVERLYEKRLVKVLYCTGTFAVGINMPARAAVFDGLERFDGKEMIRFPTREFMQMAGRAGRRGMDDAGLVVVRVDLEHWPKLAPALEAHLRGRYEPVRSSFSLSFNSIVNLMHRNPPDRIRDLVERSFLAFHRDHRARAKSGSGDTRTWDEFQRKIDFLKGIGYINEDSSFNAGAKVLMHLQIQEVFATELFLNGVLDTLPLPDLFGVLCGMCNELPRSATTRAGKEFRALARQIDQIRNSDIVVDAEQLSKFPVVWDAAMIPFGKWWAEGRSLNEILLNISSTSDVSGDLVGAFRRARELAGQLRGVWMITDPARASALGALVKEVSRAEVEVLD